MRRNDRLIVLLFVCHHCFGHKFWILFDDMKAFISRFFPDDAWKKKVLFVIVLMKLLCLLFRTKRAEGRDVHRKLSTQQVGWKVCTEFFGFQVQLFTSSPTQFRFPWNLIYFKLPFHSGGSFESRFCCFVITPGMVKEAWECISRSSVWLPSERWASGVLMEK